MRNLLSWEESTYTIFFLQAIFNYKTRTLRINGTKYAVTASSSHGLSLPRSFGLGLSKPRLNLRREKRSYNKWTKTSSSLAEAMNDCFAYVFFFFFFDLRRFIRFKAEVRRQTICSLDGVVSSLSEITRRHFYIGKILIPVVRIKRVSIMYKHRLFTVPCFFVRSRALIVK